MAIKKGIAIYAIAKKPAPMCQVLVIEVVLAEHVVITGSYYGEIRGGEMEYVEIDDLLNSLRDYGEAEVVKQQYVSTNFDSTCDVLSQRVISLDD